MWRDVEEALWATGAQDAGRREGVESEKIDRGKLTAPRAIGGTILSMSNVSCGEI